MLSPQFRLRRKFQKDRRDLFAAQTIIDLVEIIFFVHRTFWAFAAFFRFDAVARSVSTKETFHVRLFFQAAGRQKYFSHLRRGLQQAAQRITGTKFAATLQKIFLGPVDFHRHIIMLKDYY